MSNHEDNAPDQTKDSTFGLERGRSRGRSASEMDHNTPPPDASQTADAVAFNRGPLPALPLHDTDHGLLSASDDTKDLAPGSSTLDSLPLDRVNEHLIPEATNAGTNTATTNNSTDIWTDASNTRRSVSNNDSDFGFARIPSRHTTDDGNSFDIGKGRIPDYHSDDSDNGQPMEHEDINLSPPRDENPFSDHHNTTDDGNSFDIGRGRIPDFHSDDSDNGQPMEHEDINLSPPRDENSFSDRHNTTGEGRDDQDDIWDQMMDDGDDDEALQRLLAARAEDNDRIFDASNDSFFDEDEAFNRLVDELIPRPAPPIALNPEEPRMLTEEELRSKLPDHQEIYRLTTYFEEGLHIALPYDAEFDCNCSGHGLPAAHEGRRKRAASEPLPGPPKRHCPRIPNLDFLTFDAAMSRTCYLQFVPPANQGNTTQASISAQSIDIYHISDTVTAAPTSSAEDIHGNYGVDDSSSFSQLLTAKSASTNSLDVMNRGFEDTTEENSSSSEYSSSQLVTARSASTVSVDDLRTARTASVDDLRTARAASPVPRGPIVAAYPLNAAVAIAPFMVVLPLPPSLETDLEDAIDIIKDRLAFIAGPRFKRNAGALDLVCGLQRNRTTMKRLQKELDGVTSGLNTKKTRNDIQKSFDKAQKKLRELVALIRRNA